MGDRHLSPVVAILVASMTASWRIRRAILVLAILLVVSGALVGVALIGKGTPQEFLMAYVTVLIGCGFLFWWVVACLLAWIGRIVAEDVREDVGRPADGHSDH